MLAKESIFSPISSGELLQVFGQGGWLIFVFQKNCVCRKKKKDGKGQERWQGDQLGSYCFLDKK